MSSDQNLWWKIYYLSSGLINRKKIIQINTSITGILIFENPILM